jgi:uncharacterized protein YjbI with pentapeptide repeats
MPIAELQEILHLHEEWILNDQNGNRADLHGADLRDADLRDADLGYADLHGADLRGADLRGANLHSANLHSADLRGADLRGADLHGADLHNADLRGADLILIGQDIRGHFFYATQNDDGVVCIYAGCRHFTGIEDAKLHWSNRHINDPVLHEDCLSLVDRCARMALVRGWKLEAEEESHD